MEETSRKKANRCGCKFPARCVWGKSSHLQNAFLCFLLSFGVIVLFLLLHLLGCSFPSSSVLYLLVCLPLPVSALFLTENYLP